MIHDLRPYPAYSDSGMKWLGTVPEQWSTSRIKFVFRELDERSGDGQGLLLSLTRERGLVPQSAASNRLASADDLSKYKTCYPGDLVMNRMQAWSGMFSVAPCKGLVSPDYSVFRRIGSANPTYFERLFKTPTFVSQFAIRSKGIGSGFNRLYTPEFGSMPLPVPPVNEQAAIVRFLDHAERRIRRYIKSKRRLIALLNEQKQAIIQSAVTRGLDPNVRLKPSGVEWLGDVPGHWDIRRLKFLAHIKTGGRDTVDRQDQGPYPFFVRSQKIERIDTFSFDGEAVLTAGDGAGVAKVFHYVNGKFDYHQRVYKFSNFDTLKGRFFFRYFSEMLKFEAFRETAKSTVDSLRLPMLQNFPVLLPPPAEQDRICDLIDRELAGIEPLLALAGRQLNLAREYQTRLVSDVVTGKLDVREAAAGLPDEADNYDAPDDADVPVESDEQADDADLEALPEEVEA